MRVLPEICRFICWASIGAIPGVLVYATENEKWGIGVASIGAIIGLLIAATPYLYHTTSKRSLSRGLLLFFKTILGYNIPGGERLVSVKDEEVPAKGASRADAGPFDYLFERGALYGAITGVVIGLIGGQYVPQEEDHSLGFEIVFRFIFVLGSMMVFCAVGAAFAVMSIPGIHRRNIPIGTATGLLLGACVALTSVEGTKLSPRTWFLLLMGILGWLGMAAGLMADQKSRDEPDSSDE